MVNADGHNIAADLMVRINNAGAANAMTCAVLRFWRHVSAHSPASS